MSPSNSLHCAGEASSQPALTQAEGHCSSLCDRMMNLVVGSSELVQSAVSPGAPTEGLLKVQCVCVCVCVCVCIYIHMQYNFLQTVTKLYEMLGNMAKYVRYNYTLHLYTVAPCAVCGSVCLYLPCHSYLQETGEITASVCRPWVSVCLLSLFRLRWLGHTSHSKFMHSSTIFRCALVCVCVCVCVCGPFVCGHEFEFRNSNLGQVRFEGT